MRERPVRWVAAIVVAVTALGSAAVLAYAATSPLSVWEPDGSDLARSLTRTERGRLASFACDRLTAVRWRCPAEDDPYSGWSVNYALELRVDGCWRAERVRGEARTRDAPIGARPLRGCLRFRDFLGVLSSPREMESPPP